MLLANFEITEGQQSWLYKPPYSNLDMKDCVVRYTEAFYFACIGLTSVGYGDLLVTNLEHTVNGFLLLISQLFAAFVCAELTWLTSMYNQHESDMHERRRSLELALDKMGVPKVVMKRVLAFQSFENTMHADNIDKETFQGLGKNLIEELRLCTYRKLVLQAPFLREQPTEVISFIVNALWDAVYLPSDLIVRAGEHGRELFFVRRGEAKAYLGPNSPVWGQSVEVAVMKAGSYFGELAMLTGLPRGSFVMATSYCICSVLPYSAVEDLVEMHPEAFTTLVQTMVRMYNLKPEWTWKELTFKLSKKFGIETDLDAFIWLRSHTDQPEVEELHAKAFDLACQRLKVPHLDRRIFWSELDKDASGGISYDEFKGKLLFGELEGTGSCSSENYETGAEGAQSLKRRPTGPIALRHADTVESIYSRFSTVSHYHAGSHPSAETESQTTGGRRTPPSTVPAREGKRPLISRDTEASPDPLALCSSRAGSDSAYFSSTECNAVSRTEKAFALLLEQNQRLLLDIHHLHLTKI